jgi:hypothetical protein
MFAIEVKTTATEVQAGTSTRTGKPYSLTKQHGFVTLASGEHRRIAIVLQDPTKPFPPGHYTLDPDSLYVDNWGELKLGRLKLRPVAAAKAA